MPSHLYGEKPKKSEEPMFKLGQVWRRKIKGFPDALYVIAYRRGVQLHLVYIGSEPSFSGRNDSAEHLHHDGVHSLEMVRKDILSEKGRYEWEKISDWFEITWEGKDNGQNSEG